LWKASRGQRERRGCSSRLPKPENLSLKIPCPFFNLKTAISRPPGAPGRGGPFWKTRQFVPEKSLSLLYLEKPISRPPGAPGRGGPLWKLSGAFSETAQAPGNLCESFRKLARSLWGAPQASETLWEPLRELTEACGNLQRGPQVPHDREGHFGSFLEPSEPRKITNVSRETLEKRQKIMDVSSETPRKKQNYECLERNASALSESAQAPGKPLGASPRASRSL
jgi:hypothetical protein